MKNLSSYFFIFFIALISFFSNIAYATCGGGTSCSTGNACCNGDASTCYTADPGAGLASCQSCDSSEQACTYCCAMTGTACTTCVSGRFTRYSSGVWFATSMYCCGKGGAIEDYDSGVDDEGCCCQSSRIGESDDELCVGFEDSYWCIDGFFCTDETYDDSLSATDTTYTMSGNDIVCGCLSNGDKCQAASPSDTTATGLCATNTCTTTLVAKEGVAYYNACATGRECDSDVTPTATTPTYARNGYCASTTCCTGMIRSGETTNATADYTDGDEACNCTTTGEICDSSASSGSPDKEGVCAAAVIYTCTTSGAVCLDDGVYYNDMSYCDEGDPCDTDITSPAVEYVANGTVTSGSCVASGGGAAAPPIIIIID